MELWVFVLKLVIPAGDGSSPNPGFICPFEALFDGRIALSYLVNVVLFMCEPHVTSASAVGDYAAGAYMHVTRLLQDLQANPIPHRRSGSLLHSWVEG